MGGQTVTGRRMAQVCAGLAVLAEGLRAAVSGTGGVPSAVLGLHETITQD